jgi:hypothetical protein
MKISQMRKAINKKLHIHRRDLPPYTGWNRNSIREDIYDLFNQFGYSYGAEIGVRRAVNAMHICRRIPGVKLILVDPWVKYGRSITKERAERHYQVSLKRMKRFDTVFMRTTSMEAVKQIADASLDFVYIDALHDFNNVIMDLIHWSPKVKKGGVISGHDYVANVQTGVLRAVDAYVQAHGITHLYVTRRATPSFFWIKQ